MPGFAHDSSIGRRDMLVVTGIGLVLTTAGLGLPRARADLAAMQARIDDLAAGRALQAGRITLDLPEVAENGATVPLAVEIESPMTGDNHVKALYLFAERNPHPEVASFHFTPRSGRAMVATRIRLAESQRVHALAEMSDGSLFTVAREVQVTIGGCGG